MSARVGQFSRILAHGHREIVREATAKPRRDVVAEAIRTAAQRAFDRGRQDVALTLGRAADAIDDETAADLWRLLR